jgi:hypothetical protein
MNQATITPEMIKGHAKNISDGFDNAFPVGVFPEKIQWIIEATNESLKYPIDFTGCSMLFAAAIAIGNTHRAKVMNTWQEHATLYIALIGRPGTNKTHPLKFALDPILERDKLTYKEYQKAKAEYQSLLGQPKDGTEMPPKPFWKKIIISDFTPEALSEIHRFNLRGLGVYSDEINQWLKNFNRYSTGSATEFWLSNFSGIPITIDRKGQDPILISSPSISVCGSIQPGILQELGRDSRSQNGFIDRILFSFPESLKKEYWSETELNEDVPQLWKTIINNLLDMPLLTDNTGEIEPAVIEFNEPAKDILKNWQRKNTDAANHTESESLAGIYTKLENYCIRFALILELLQVAAGESELENPTDWDIKKLYRKASMKCHPDQSSLPNAAEIFRELHAAFEANNRKKVMAIFQRLNKPRIGTRATEGAIQLTEYFRQTARRVNSILNNTPVEGLDTRKKSIYHLLPDEFSTDKGLQIAYENDFPERTLKRFLSDGIFFEKLEHGKYKKRF